MNNVLILGAHSDIAQAIAARFALQKCNIILAARNADMLQSTISDLKIRFHIDAFECEFDAQNFGSHQGFYNQLPIVPDIVICVFGYLGNQAMAMDNFLEAHQIIDVNYTGAVSILNIAADRLIKKGGGTIIGISSVAGERGRMSNFIYGSAKAGFTAYLSGLRNMGFHNGLHVLTVKPGFVKTRMTEGLVLNPKLTATPKQVADDIFKAYKSKKNTIYTLWFWKYIMLIIKTIPESVFKKLKL